MSSKERRIIITRQESPLLTFHIKYMGLAAVSMFFHVEKMKADKEEQVDEEKKGEEAE